MKLVNKNSGTHPQKDVQLSKKPRPWIVYSRPKIISPVLNKLSIVLVLSSITLSV